MPRSLKMLKKDRLMYSEEGYTDGCWGRRYNDGCRGRTDWWMLSRWRRIDWRMQGRTIWWILKMDRLIDAEKGQTDGWSWGIEKSKITERADCLLLKKHSTSDISRATGRLARSRRCSRWECNARVPFKWQRGACEDQNQFCPGGADERRLSYRSSPVTGYLADFPFTYSSLILVLFSWLKVFSSLKRERCVSMRKIRTSRNARNKRPIYPNQRKLNRDVSLIYSDWIVDKYEEFDMIMAFSPPFKI